MPRYGRFALSSAPSLAPARMSAASVLPRSRRRGALRIQRAKGSSIKPAGVGHVTLETFLVVGANATDSRREDASCVLSSELEESSTGRSRKGRRGANNRRDVLHRDATRWCGSPVVERCPSPCCVACAKRLGLQRAAGVVLSDAPRRGPCGLSHPDRSLR